MHLEVDGGAVRLQVAHELDCLQQTEACAQAIAVLMGGQQWGEQRGQTGEPASGMLVAASNIDCADALPAGVAARVEAKRLHALGSLHLWEVCLSTEAGECCLTGQLHIAQGSIGGDDAAA